MKKDNLVRKVEKSFDFVQDYSDVEFRGYKNPQLVKRRKEGLGFDVSLYLDSKLCLSPDDYCRLQNNEKEVYRGLEPSKVKPLFIQLIKTVMGDFSEASKVYQIREAQTGSEGFSYQSCPHINLSRSDYQELFILDENEKLRPEILERFWARRPPKNTDVDGYRGNDMGIHIVTHNFEKFWDIVKHTNLDLLEKIDDEKLKKMSAVTISNLSHGYRMRVECQNDGILKKILGLI